MKWRQNFSDSVRDGIASGPSSSRALEEPDDRGVALVITLLLLLLLSVIGLAAVLSTSSDMLINGYYSNYRGSFYAADSGLSVARQAMNNQLSGAFSTAFGTFVTPPPTDLNSLINGVGPAIIGAYGSTTSLPAAQILSGSASTNAGAAANSWSESFRITQASIGLAPVTPNPTPGYTGDLITSYNYLYNYTLQSVGSARGSEQSTVTENGSFTINVSGVPASYNESFSIYGAFITNYPPCLGPLVPGTMTGPMFTDGAWGFWPYGTYIFTDPVGQALANASYFDGNWTCYQSPTSSFTAPNGQVIAPQFQAGFNLHQNPITQPTDSFSQMWAALDGTGCGEDSTACGGTISPPAPTSAQMNAVLKNVNQTPYPTSGATSGVYLNYQNVNGTLTMAGGGLYVQGDASLLLAAQTATNGDLLQVFTVKQGSTTTTMTVDLTANTTVVNSGTTTLTLAGVPANCSALGAPPTHCTTVPSITTGSTPGTMVYVNGKITGMSGPGEGVGAIQDGAAVTITALNDIDITGDVIYKTEPVTMTQNQIPGTPPSTLIPGNDHNQDLGIFTANGNIVMSSPYPDDNLQVDGSQAVIGANCASWSCGFLVNGCINTFNNVGGQIQTNIFGACLNTENTYYDRRYMSRAGFAPPWFPSTTVTNTSAVTNPPILTVQRTNWTASVGQ
jgi:Tfp pilus assembly protein PilX